MVLSIAKRKLSKINFEKFPRFCAKLWYNIAMENKGIIDYFEGIETEKEYNDRKSVV